MVLLSLLSAPALRVAHDPSPASWSTVSPSSNDGLVQKWACGLTGTVRLDMEFLFLNWYSWWCELMWDLMMREAHYMKHESETNPQEAEPSNDFLGPHLSPESIHMGSLIHSCIFQSCVPVRSSSSFFSFSSSSSSSSSSYLYLGFCYLSYN